jgi:DNA-binding NarL/FixJ family response regulator
MSRPTTLALVDDHEIFRAALAHTLRDFGFEIVVEGGDARAVFPSIDAAKPDVVLLDLRLPAMDGVTALRELRARSRMQRIMILTGSTNPYDLAAAWSAGADGYATKSIDLEQLTEGLQCVAAGMRFLQPGLAVESAGDGPIAALSARERDVFRLLVRGLTSADIAGQLCIAVKTAETHRERVMKKLGVHSAAQLVRFAVMNHLLAAEL